MEKNVDDTIHGFGLDHLASQLLHCGENAP